MREEIPILTVSTGPVRTVGEDCNRTRQNAAMRCAKTRENTTGRAAKNKEIVCSSERELTKKSATDVVTGKRMKSRLLSVTRE